MGSVLLAGGQDSRTECSARHQHFFFSSSSSEPFFNPKPLLFQKISTMINHCPFKAVAHPGTQHRQPPSSCCLSFCLPPDYFIGLQVTLPRPKLPGQSKN